MSSFSVNLNGVGQAVTGELRAWPPPVEGAVSSGKGKEPSYVLFDYFLGGGDMSCMVQLGFTCQTYSIGICGK